MDSLDYPVSFPSFEHTNFSTSPTVDKWFSDFVEKQEKQQVAPVAAKILGKTETANDKNKLQHARTVVPAQAVKDSKVYFISQAVLSKPLEAIHLPVRSTAATIEDLIKILETGREIPECMHPVAAKLTELNLGMSHKLTPKSIMYLISLCINLKTLKLPVWTSEYVINFLSFNKTIETLDLRGSHNLTNFGLYSISFIKTLKHLNISQCKNVDDNGIVHVSELKGLQHLNLSWCDNITDKSLLHISHLTDLKHLDLRSCKKITDEGLKFIPKLQELCSLNMSDCGGISDVSLSYVSQLLFLQNLELSWCENITSEGIKLIYNLQLLTRLVLRGSKEISDDSLETIAKLPFIQHLDLSECDLITNKAIVENIRKLENLQYLDIGGCNVLDSGVVVISGLPKIRFLYLNKCKEITDSCLSAISLNQTLEMVSLKDCQSLTVNGINSMNPRIKKFH